MGNVSCRKDTSTGTYSCTYEKLIQSDRSVIEILLRDELGNRIDSPEELAKLMRGVKGEDPGGMNIVGDDENGVLVNAELAPSSYDIVHAFDDSSSNTKKRFLYVPSGAYGDMRDKVKFRVAKTVSLANLGHDERADSAIRSVARVLDIPFSPNVAQPESVFWAEDSNSLVSVLEQADTNLGNLGSMIARMPTRGSLFVYLALHLVKGLQAVHNSGNALGDVSSANIYVYKVHGIPELKVVPGKRTVRSPETQQRRRQLAKQVSVIAEAVGRQAGESLVLRDLDTVPCAFVEPGSQMAPSFAGDIWSAGSSMFQALTGVAYGCACDLPDYADRLARLETLPPQVEPSTFWKYFRAEMLVPKKLDRVEYDAMFANMGPYTAPLLALIRRMLILNPDKRATANDLLEDPVFQMKPHPQSAFANFLDMDAFVSKFKAMPSEARFKLLREAAEQDLQYKTAPKLLSFPLQSLRERLVKSLMSEFDTRYPGLETPLRDALQKAVRLTDRMLRADTGYGEYARLMLANWAFSLNVGTSISFDKRKELLQKTVEHCVKQFQLDLDVDTIAKTQASILAREKAGLYVEENTARQAGELTSDELDALVSQRLSSNAYAQEQKAYKDQRGYVAFGPFSGKYGRVLSVKGLGKEAKFLMQLDDGEKVLIDRENFATVAVDEKKSRRD